MTAHQLDTGINLKEDVMGSGKTPFCIGMQRNKLLTRKVASELSFVMNGGGVSDSVFEFANEWWNFRYHTLGKNVKLLGPSAGRKICGTLQDSEKNEARAELSTAAAVMLPIQFSYTCDPAGVSSIDEQWSLLIFFPKNSLFLHFDSGLGMPNEANFTAQNTAQKLFDIVGRGKQGGDSFKLVTLECVKQQKQSDSGIYAMATTACLAKYLRELLDKTTEDLGNLAERLTQLIRCNITPDYILFLRSFLKRLHSKLHQKLYESVMMRRSFGKDKVSETENVAHKRKLECPTPGSEKPRK